MRMVIRRMLSPARATSCLPLRPQARKGPPSRKSLAFCASPFFPSQIDLTLTLLFQSTSTVFRNILLVSTSSTIPRSRMVSRRFSGRIRWPPNFSIALTTPACFQVILARSALYRLSLSKYSGEKQKKALEVVMMRHKSEALRLIRALSAKSSPNRKDDLIASIISLGTLDRRTGSSDAAGMHFMAVRRILKATGGPLAVRSLLLSRVMVFFECIYDTSPESYIWDEADLRQLLPDLNTFLVESGHFGSRPPHLLSSALETASTQPLPVPMIIFDVTLSPALHFRKSSPAQLVQQCPQKQTRSSRSTA